MFKRFKNQFTEIKSEVLGLNESQNNIFDSILAPVFFVLTFRFFDLNIAIISTAVLVALTFGYRLVKKDGPPRLANLSLLNHHPITF